MEAGDVHFRCFGKPQLADLGEAQPLLLLAFMHLSAKTSRSELAELFWPHKTDRELRFKSLSSALRKLRKAAPGVVESRGKTEVATGVPTDVDAFLAAFKEGDFDRAVALYRGPFLEGVERDKRFVLGEELEEWLFNTREALQTTYLETLLGLGERRARLEDFKGAAAFAWRAFSLDKAISYPNPEDYERMHLLLLSAGRDKDAAGVAAEAAHVYGELDLAPHPQAARARLTFTLHLPAATSTFVDRERELKCLRHWLTATPTRLVTLSGVGGVGKTELAVKLAREARAAWNGLFFVALETLSPNSSPDALWLHVAAGLGLKQGARPPFESLTAFLGTKRALLILDNFEHIKAHGGALARLLASCPELRVLVTSRERLNLEGERLLELHGLSYASAETSSALELLYRRSERLGVTLPPAARTDALSLVELVEGHPLAIKLAAAWLGSRQMSDIVQSLEKGLESLASGPPDSAERHRSIRATFELSYALLDPAEQKVFSDLAVFAGAFSREAAAEVVAAQVAQLRSLVDKSLLQFDQGSGSYRLHTLLRHYAKALQQDATGLQNVHARYFLGQLRQMTSKEQAVKNEAPGKLSRVAQDLFVAWEWATKQAWQEDISETALALMLFGNASSKMREVGALFEGTLEAFPGAEAAFRGRLLSNLTWCYLRQENYLKTINIAQRGDQLLQNGEDRVAKSNVLLALATANQELGNFEVAKQSYLQNVTLCKGDERSYANAIANLVPLSIRLGNFSDAQSYLEEAKEVYEKLEMTGKLFWLETQYGQLLFERGQLFKAEAVLEAVRAKANKQRFVFWEIRAEEYLAFISVERGALERAEALGHKLLTRGKTDSNLWLEARALTVLSHIAFVAGELPQAKRLLHDSLLKISTLQNVPGVLYRLICDLRLRLTMDELVTASRLYGFLTQPKVLEKTCYSDKQLFQTVTRPFLTNFEQNPPLLENWQDLAIREVVTLVLND